MVTRNSFNTRTLLMALAMAGTCVSAHAAVSAQEAATLKTTLTPMGAERAGNKEGTIPAWDGGYTKADASFKGDQPRTDPFAAEKARLSITAQNLAQHAGKLAEGAQAMFKKYPDWRIDVYPTHRTAAAPQWVYDNTFKNATRTQLANDGNAIKSAYGGAPFPVPKNGAEVMWNHLTAWKGESFSLIAETWVTASDGNHVLATVSKGDEQFPYYDAKGSLESFGGDFLWFMQENQAPAFKKGERILVHDPLNMAEGGGRKAWQYLTGQRRVRVAPTIGFDTPNFILSGVANFDEGFIFNGSLERYTWKLVGKKELYVPYNQNRLAAVKSFSDDTLRPHFRNPDLSRWELHRVWVVEAELRQGQRHVEPKRRFYIDEDSWQALLGENYDAQGHLWKFLEAETLLLPDLPGVVVPIATVNNLLDSTYVSSGLSAAGGPIKVLPNRPTRMFSPEALAGSATK